METEFVKCVTCNKNRWSSITHDMCGYCVLKTNGLELNESQELRMKQFIEAEQLDTYPPVITTS